MLLHNYSGTFVRGSGSGGTARRPTLSHAHLHDDAPVTASKKAEGKRELVGQAVTINRPARELYDFWRDFPNLAMVMENIVAIEKLDERRSHWVVRAPGGRTVEWDAEVTNDVPGREITWQSSGDEDVANSGRVSFVEVPGRGTVVTATIAYEPPAGAVGKIIAKVMQREPNVQARRDLRRFKQLMETGEIATAARNRRELAEETK
jgi:uncharacterized membrane protein